MVGGGEIDGGLRSACGAAMERRDSAMERRGAACGRGREIGERNRLEKIRFYRGLFTIFASVAPRRVPRQRQKLAWRVWDLEWNT